MYAPVKSDTICVMSLLVSSHAPLPAVVQRRRAVDQEAILVALAECEGQLSLELVHDMPSGLVHEL